MSNKIITLLFLWGLGIGTFGYYCGASDQYRKNTGNQIGKPWSKHAYALLPEIYINATEGPK